MSPAAPWITKTELEDHLGAELTTTEANRLIYLATDTVANVVNLVDENGDPLTQVPDSVQTVCLYLAAEVYKAGQGVDGSFQVDWTQQVTVQLTSVLVKRYGALLAPWIAIGGLVG